MLTKEEILIRCGFDGKDLDAGTKSQNEQLEKKRFTFSQLVNMRNEKLSRPFSKLVENIFNTFKFCYMENGPDSTLRTHGEVRSFSRVKPAV